MHLSCSNFCSPIVIETKYRLNILKPFLSGAHLRSAMYGSSPPLPSPLVPPRPCIDPPAPLSLSSGGLAGRSGGERGGRPPCIVCRIGCFLGAGPLPCLSCSPAPPGGAGRRQAPLPHRHPCRAVAGAGSGLSSSNKPARSGSSYLVRDPAPIHRSGRGGKIGGAWLDSAVGALDSQLPVARKLLSRWSSSQQPPPSSSAGHGGRIWRLGLLPHFIRAVVSLLVPPVLAGRGGEGLGVRRRDAAEGGNPRLLPSGGGGVAEWPDMIAAAWCCGLPGLDLEAPPPNKLKDVRLACRPDELSRRVLCGSGRRCGRRSPSSSWVLLLLLAGLGGEGEDEECLALLLCWRWPGAFFELIITDAFIASVILCRQGGNSSASMLEACSRHCRGCLNSLRGKVIRSPHRREGPWWMSVVGRGLPSSWSLLLGGDASRTSAKGGDDAQGPDCFLSLCSWVFFCKEMALSVRWAFPRAALSHGCFCNLYSPRDQ
jgi:hypothetical protein